MRQNTAKRKTARPRLFAVFFTFWGINGRRTVSFNPARNASYKAIARRVFTFSSILFGLCVWLFPSSALAEWGESNDRYNLGRIVDNTSTISLDTGKIYTENTKISYDLNRLLLLSQGDSENFSKILSSLGYFDDYGLKNGSLMNDLMAVKTGINLLNENDLDKLDYLQRIEDFLSNIEALLESNSGGSGSGGSGSTEINQDWVKETTFQEYSDNFQTYSDNFQTYYDWMKVSFGFDEPNSSPYDSPASFVEMLLTERYIQPFQYWKFNDLEAVGAAKVPFPGSPYTWVNEYPDWTTNMNSTRLALTFSQLFTYPIMTQLSEGTIQDVKLFKKAAWNDWQAHTNLVATLERLLDYQPPENRVDSTSDIGTIMQSQNGGEVLNITYDSGTGDSPESIDLTPSYTNNVAQLSTDADDIKKDFDDIWDYNKIKERYVDSEKIKDTSSFQDVQQKEISDYVIQYGNKPYMAFRWSSTALRMYKAIFTYDRMRLLRSTFGRMWNLLVIWGCYVLFRILGKANA